MSRVPDIAIVVDPKREATAIAECRKLGITIISILDTNCDPNVVDIPIPANDDAVKEGVFKDILCVCVPVCQWLPCPRAHDVLVLQRSPRVVTDLQSFE